MNYLDSMSLNKKEVLQILKENEEKSKKFHEVEIKILKTLNFKDIFEILLNEIMERFKVPFVWLSIIEDSEVDKLLKTIEISKILSTRINIINKEKFLNIINSKTKPLLENTDLTPFFMLFPHDRTFFLKAMSVAPMSVKKDDLGNFVKSDVLGNFVKSIAISPISLDGEIIGSFNQADSNVERFKPGMETDLLEQLAIKVSICLSNVTAHEKLKHMAYHDPLTGLLNRRIMKKTLSTEFKRAKRYSSNLSLIFLDLNYFKQVNDTYGHDQGDNLLKYVANTLFEKSRESDIVARFAGDEFVVILPETNSEMAHRHVLRIQEFFRKNPMETNGNSIEASISFGISSTEEKDLNTPEDMLKRADERLYEVKNSRKQETSP